MPDTEKIRLVVSFEAEGPEALDEAVRSFFEEFLAKKQPTETVSMSTAGWRYSAEVKP